MTIALDATTETNLRLIADRRSQSVEAYLATLIEREARSLNGPEAARQGTLHDFLMNSPLRGAELDLERVVDYPRSVELE